MRETGTLSEEQKLLWGLTIRCICDREGFRGRSEKKRRGAQLKERVGAGASEKWSDAWQRASGPPQVTGQLGGG